MQSDMKLDEHKEAEDEYFSSGLGLLCINNSV